MSQSGLIDIEGSHPQILTQIDGDTGSAVPIANVLEIQGLTVANALYSKPQFVTASGNTVVVNQQVGKAVTGAPSDKLKAGSVSFDDTTFAVTEHGYVTQISSGVDTATANFIVDPAGTKAEYTTIASAISAASANDVIFVKEGTYTEDLVIDKLLTIVGYTESTRNVPNPVIIQPSSASFLITESVKFENVHIKTNGSTICTLSTASKVINFFNCRISVETAKTGFVNTTGGTSSSFDFRNCHIAGTGTAVFFDVQQGNCGIRRCWVEGFTTTSTIATGTCVVAYSYLSSLPITTSSTGHVLADYSEFGTTLTPYQNVTYLTTAGTGVSSIQNCKLYSGTASAVSIGTGTTVECYNSNVNSSNTNAITGAGTFDYSSVVFSGTSSEINSSTPTLQTTNYTQLGKYRAEGQPAFLAVNSVTDANQTGNGADATVDFDTEVFDQNSNFATDTFTAPVTGKYQICFQVTITAFSAAMTDAYTFLVASNGTYYGSRQNPNAVVANSWVIANTSILVDMDKDDTATVHIVVNGGVGDTASIMGSNNQTYFSAVLVC